MAEVKFDIEAMIGDPDLYIEIPVNIEVTLDLWAATSKSELIGFEVTCKDIPGINTKAIEKHLQEQWKKDDKFRRRLCYRGQEVFEVAA